MASHQVTVFLTPADLDEVERRIRSVGDVVFLASASAGLEPQVLPDLRIEEMGRTPLVVYAVQPCDLPAVVMRENPISGDHRVDVMRSPVIEIVRCFFDEGAGLLRSGRLYYVRSYFGDRGETVTKSLAFLEWAKRVLGTTVDGLQRSGTDYIGRAAASWKARNPNAKLAVL
jgi:hypothetical protein